MIRWLILGLIAFFSTAAFWSFSFQMIDEPGRWSELAWNTVRLVALTISITLPLAILLAIALFRSNLFGVRFLQNCLWVGMVIPLPVLISTWQMAIGPTGWLVPESMQQSQFWRPWSEGLLPAAILHSVAALPWMTFLIGFALQSVEAELETDAAMILSPGQVILQVSLRRIGPQLVLLTLLLVAQVAGEIVITDVMLVRTFAEEIYTQYVLDRSQLPAVALLAIPQTMLFGLIGYLCLTRSTNAIRFDVKESPMRLHFAGWNRRFLSLGLALLAAIAVLLPLVSLFKRAIGSSNELSDLWQRMEQTFRVHTGIIAESLCFSLIVGFGVTALTYRLLSRIPRQPILERVTLMLAAWVWLLPAPLLGFSVKMGIEQWIDWEEAILPRNLFHPIRESFYDQPTPFPVMLCQAIKFFPISVLILLPALRRLPRNLSDDLLVMGCSSRERFRLVDWPLLRGSLLLSGLLTTVLALGEISASKLVEVPGRVTFAHELFRQMHYGADTTVGIFCLIQLALVFGICILIFTLTNNHYPKAKQS